MLPRSPPPRTHHGAGSPGKTHWASRPPQSQLQENTGQAEEQPGYGPSKGGSTRQERPDGAKDRGLCRTQSDGAPETPYHGSSGASEPTMNGTEEAEGGLVGGKAPSVGMG